MTSKELIDALEDAGFEATSYSGRGMYGKSCVAVKNESLWAIARSTADLNLREPTSDQLGRGMVYYWPSYEWPSEVTA